ncbi:putative nicotinamide mononucleotide adenylyl transferase protein [Phaeoacremonium minimum UCRPA7]|uniref:Nicotinamide-nucleotide adenylyltransferase n=1 Tax=Phaeoacremonium minimum (strain UCR-PA7) TaxID=1286976 RepID=R8BKL8_PHAM7|nr:putative nicotinamide mononucleotide adenylyl transferase protein [Phaeoacremonium minimum UCRPA7]EON99851.1 putative nicotinamide mononucleotide adenylyl transferase protein [Phaeoacremonium minimum UCRPA7]
MTAPIDQNPQHEQDQAQSAPEQLVADSQMSPETYQFPSQRLVRRQKQAGKTPLVLVACGSFSPITYLHLRMFEMASDFVRFNTDFEVVGGFLSPVSDAYKKVGLAPAYHRIEMCELAARETSTWLSCDPWEAIQPDYVPTAEVLDHFDHEINEVLGGVEDVHGNRRPVRIALLAGADLIQTMSTPGVWSPRDLDHILRKYGTFIIERSGTDIEEALASLKQWQENIYVIQQVVQNDISSTKVRLFLKRDMSVRYLIPEPVIQHIEKNHLYEDPKKKEDDDKDKGKTLSSDAASQTDEPTKAESSRHASEG